MSRRPLVGVSPDVTEPRPGSLRAVAGLAYLEALDAAGAEPLVLAPLPGRVQEQLQCCAAIVLTGGDDPRTERYGEPTHAAATPVHARRQAYDEALVQALLAQPEVPLLAICLGAQMLALGAGGRLHQHLPELTPAPEAHQGVNHPVRALPGHSLLADAEVYSTHHQAVADGGPLRPVAWAPDGVIEALDDPTAAFRLAVQWHPERTVDPAGGRRLFEALVAAARARR